MPPSRSFILAVPSACPLREEVDELVHESLLALRLGLAGQLADVEVAGHGRCATSASKLAARAGGARDSRGVEHEDVVEERSRPGRRPARAMSLDDARRSRWPSDRRASTPRKPRVVLRRAEARPRWRWRLPRKRSGAGGCRRTPRRCLARMLSTRLVSSTSFAKSLAPSQLSTASSRASASPDRPAIRDRRAPHLGLQHRPISSAS